MSNGFSPFAMLQSRVQPDATQIGVQPDQKTPLPGSKPAAVKPGSPGSLSFADTLAATSSAASQPKQPAKVAAKTPDTRSQVNETINRATNKTSAPKASDIEKSLADVRKSEPATNARLGKTTKDAITEPLSQLNSLPTRADSEMSAPITGPLKELAERARKIVGDSPVLSFLSGDYGRFAPEEISSFIADSEFLNTALEQTDFQAFLNQPLPLGQILADLQLSPQLIDQIKALGLNMDELATLRQVFEVLGMNPQNVATEIETLRTNLQVAGTSMYMRKAAKSRMQAIEQPIAAAQNHTMTKASPELQEDDSTLNAPVLTKRGKTIDSEEMVSVATGLTPPIVPTNNPSKNLVDSPVNNAPLLETRGIMVESESTAPMAGLVAETAELTSVIMPEVASDQASSPMAKLASSDPFAALDQRLASTETAAMPEAEPVASELMANFETAPVANDAAPADSSVMAMLSRNYLKQTPTPVVDNVNETILPSDQVVYESADLGMNANTAQEAGGLQTVVPKEVQQARLEMQMERLALGLDAKSLGSATMGDQHAQPDLGQSGSGAETFDQFHLNHSFGQGIATKPASSGSFATQLTTQSPLPAMMKPIIENASMMLHEGGGSIQIDLGSAELGELKVALSLKDQQLDLRIIASSQAARDLLNQELPKLRDSLAQQNLTLNDVQVGVGSESAQQQYAGGFGDRRDSLQQHQDIFNTSAIGREGVRKFAARSTYAPMGRMSMRAGHTGQIQVSV